MSCMSLTYVQSIAFSLSPVAYPEPDKNITATVTYFATLSKDSPPIRCDFLRGSLAGTNDYYTVQWWKGSETLASWNNNTQDDCKYRVLDNFSLVVHNVTFLDASDAYYCSVAVQYETSSEVTSVGVNYELVVVGKQLFVYECVSVSVCVCVCM